MLFTYKELIDLAIGTPESGHVNFYALQVLLTCFAQRLEVLDKVVEVQNSFHLGMDSEFRLFAGADEEGEAPGESANEAAEEEAVEEAPVQEAPVEEAPVVEAPVEEAPVEEAPVEEAPVQEPPVAEAPVEEAAAEESPPQPLTEGDTKIKIEIIEGKTDGDGTEPGPDSAETEQVPDDANQAAQVTTPSRKEGESLLSARSSHRKLPSTVDPSVVTTIMRLEKRLSLIEVNNEKAVVDMEQFVSHFKVQMMLTIEQINNVAHILIDRKRDPHRIKVVRLFAKQLKALLQTGSTKEISVSWSSDDVDVDADQEEDLIEDDFLEEDYSGMAEFTASQPSAFLKGDMPLGLERVYNDVVHLKTQVCALTNNVNDLADLMVKHDCQVLLGKFGQLQNGIQDLHVFKSSTQEATSHIMDILNGATKQIDNLQRSALLLDERKSDRMEVELMMAEKVNFEQLGTKVSLEQLEDFKFTLDKMFCEVRNVVSENERNVLEIIDNLRMTLGIDAMEVGLKEFRQMIEKRVGMIADALQGYMEMTNDECAAAAGRVKVMQDLACLSCDTTCLMRTVERQKLPSMPTAKGSVGLAPLVAYDVGQIRGTGLMGYYRKDEFPCSPHAWTKGTSRVPLDKCNPRHAGGVHTVHTAEEHVQKVVLSKRNSGWV
ncbi:uncharacterized protein LOC110179238 isoform X1 [Drosophila serrata]|uniref:uncharacterized protein LOC110179238 isoform X1 n=1 Tax=Drosophila serrata TaxID=7274 RepID=UPI000A1D29B7|nr:uncharacterized protein LOC110179238 isoform X1 [Drosophila serrata]